MKMKKVGKKKIREDSDIEREKLVLKKKCEKKS